MSIRTAIGTSTAAFALVLAPAMLTSASAEETAEKAATPIDTNGDGKPDAWDTNGDGKPDAWDTNGDGQPDAFDTDGDGKPDKSETPQ